jgi:hypothetical protein
VFEMHDNLGAFSDTWYSGRYSVVDAPALLNECGLYTLSRMDLSGQQTLLDYVRVSTYPVGDREAVVFDAQDIIGVGGKAAGTYSAPGFSRASDHPSVALLLRRIRKGGAKMFLRGIPDAVVDTGGQFRDVGGYVANLNALQAQVIALNWGFVGRPTAIANSPSIITAAIQNPDNTTTFTLNNPMFSLFAPGARVSARISHQVQPKYLNGTLTVTAGTDPAKCTSLRPLPLGNFTGGTGQMSVKVPNFIATDVISIERVVTRKAGRPFGVLVGRRKPARSI